MDNGRTLISIKDVTKVYRMGGASTCMPCVELAQRCTLARCWPSASSLACIPLIALRGLIRLTRFATNRSEA